MIAKLRRRQITLVTDDLRQATQEGDPLAKQAAIVVDLDNTLFDTAKRKHAIIHAMLGADAPVTLEQVRGDFHLTSVLGAEDTRSTPDELERMRQELEDLEYVEFPDSLDMEIDPEERPEIEEDA